MMNCGGLLRRSMGIVLAAAVLLTVSSELLSLDTGENFRQL